MEHTIYLVTFVPSCFLSNGVFTPCSNFESCILVVLKFDWSFSCVLCFLVYAVIFLIFVGLAGRQLVFSFDIYVFSGFGKFL